MGEGSGDSGAWRGRIVNFIFGTVLAGLVTTAFTYKSWREQTRLDFAKERLKEATATFDKTSQLMSARIFRSYDVTRHIGDADDTFAKRRDKLDTAIDEWNLAYPDLLQRFQFTLETGEDGAVRPFKEVRTSEFDSKLDCSKAFDEHNRPQHADYTSPSWLLAAFHHCLIHTNIARKSDELAKIPANADRYAKIVEMDTRVDDLATHANHVRIASKKAIQRLREGAEAHGFVEFLRAW